MVLWCGAKDGGLRVRSLSREEKEARPAGERGTCVLRLSEGCTHVDPNHSAAQLPIIAVAARIGAIFSIIEAASPRPAHGDIRGAQRCEHVAGAAIGQVILVQRYCG